MFDADDKTEIEAGVLQLIRDGHTHLAQLDSAAQHRHKELLERLQRAGGAWRSSRRVIDHTLQRLRRRGKVAYAGAVDGWYCD